MAACFVASTGLGVGPETATVLFGTDNGTLLPFETLDKLTVMADLLEKQWQKNRKKVAA